MATIQKIKALPQKLNNAFYFKCCYKYVVRNIHIAVAPQLSISFERASYGECVSLESIKCNHVFI